MTSTQHFKNIINHLSNQDVKVLGKKKVNNKSFILTLEVTGLDKIKELKTFDNYVFDGFYVKANGQVEILYYVKDAFEEAKETLQKELTNIGLQVLAIESKKIDNAGGFDVLATKGTYVGDLKDLHDFGGLTFDGYASTVADDSYVLFYYFE